MTSHRAFLEELYAVAIAAAHPRALVAEAVTPLCLGDAAPRRFSIIAIGKAAPAMAESAVEQLTRHGASIVSGIIVGSNDGGSPDRRIERVAGDHPIPGARSLHAATMLAHATRYARDGADAALVLISGGATSLVGSPVEGVTPEALIALYDALLRSGWDIGEMNAVRKRFLQWGAGRLALALAPIAVHPVILSDVIGDDPGIIASGPCAPDTLSASDVLDRLERLTLRDASSRRSLTDHLERVVRGEFPETAKPGDPGLIGVAPAVIGGNLTAVAAMAIHAREVGGWLVRFGRTSIRGEARERGVEIATHLLATREEAPLCVIYSGETTVTMPDGATGQGGRCQELALAAARVLDDAGSGAAIAVMAAGTDGRDGPTDAAGAIVDGDSCRRARANGVEPEQALATYDSHRALAAAGALMPARVTGTNVMDIVVGLVDRR